MRIIRNATFRILPPQPGSPLSCVRRAAEKQVARISKWWEDFEPNDTVPMPAGSFIRRVARTPHYDGVKKDGREPAVIAICGTGPITYHLVDPSKPDLRVL